MGAEYERPRLAELWGYGSHHAISRGVVTPRGTPYVILFVTKEKQEALTQYRDFLAGDVLHWEGEEQHGSDDRILRSKLVGDQIHLFYRERHHSPFSYLGEIELIDHEARSDGSSRFTFRVSALSTARERDPFQDVRKNSAQLEGLEQTEREAIVQSRVGQGRFRRDVLALWGGCAVTGVSDSQVVVASHVKPWSDSSNEERLDPNNGLALIPNLDALFDGGLITFNSDGFLRASHLIDPHVLATLGVMAGMRLRKTSEDLGRYLSYHRRYVFRETTRDLGTDPDKVGDAI